MDNKVMISIHDSKVLPFTIISNNKYIELSLNDVERLVNVLPKYIEEHKEYLAGNTSKFYELEKQIAELTIQLNNLKDDKNPPPKKQFDPNIAPMHPRAGELYKVLKRGGTL